MEVVSFKLYQRKLIFDDLSAIFYNGRGRERVGLTGGGLVCVCVWGGGGGGGKGGEKDRKTDGERQRERVAFKSCCLSTVLQVTAVEVKPI